METSIGVNHLAELTRLKQLCQYMDSERERLMIEMRYIVVQRQQAEAQLMLILREAYHIDGQSMPVVLDTDRGVIVTPDPPEPPEGPSAVPKAEANGA